MDDGMARLDAAIARVEAILNRHAAETTRTSGSDRQRARYTPGMDTTEMIGGPLDGKTLTGIGSPMPVIRYPAGDDDTDTVAVYELDTSGQAPVYRYAGDAPG